MAARPCSGTHDHDANGSVAHTYSAVCLGDGEPEHSSARRTCSSDSTTSSTALATSAATAPETMAGQTGWCRVEWAQCASRLGLGSWNMDGTTVGVIVTPKASVTSRAGAAASGSSRGISKPSKVCMASVAAVQGRGVATRRRSSAHSGAAALLTQPRCCWPARRRYYRAVVTAAGARLPRGQMGESSGAIAPRGLYAAVGLHRKLPQCY